MQTQITYKCLLASMFIMLSSLAYSDHGAIPGEDSTFDAPYYSSGQTVKVYLHHNTFRDLDFPDSFTTWALENATRTAVKRWTQISGVNLNLVYAGLDSNDDHLETLQRGEIHIGAVRDLREFNRPEYSAAVTVGASRIFFARKIGKNFDEDNLDGVFLPDVDGDTEGLNYLGVLMHEMGHALGLGHNQDSINKTIMRLPDDYGQHAYYHYGPFKEDIEDLLDLYGERPKMDATVMVIRDDDTNWKKVKSNIASTDIDTTMPLSVSADGQRMVAFYRNTYREPEWRFGSSDAKTWDSKAFYRSNSWVLHGVSGHGYHNHYMMTWTREKNAYVRVRYGEYDKDQDAIVWNFVSPPDSYAGGTPAVLQLNSSAGIWVLAYTKLDWNNSQNNGKVVLRYTLDNGASWSDENVISDYRAVGDINLIARSTQHFDVIFEAMSDSEYKTSKSIGGMRVSEFLNLVGTSLTSEGTYISESNTGQLDAVYNDGKKAIVYEDIKGRLQTSGVIRPKGIPDLLPVRASLAASSNSSRIFLFYMND